MAKAMENGHGVIRVADITIAQLSRGLYRSNATAFKELVSNAYDADATFVQIDTNFPEFDFISCFDNGTGMPLEEFIRYFDKTGIGSCNKRKGNRDFTNEYKRPIIGRMGIGMLAIGQLCHSFNIESHYKDKHGDQKAYLATIVLEDISIEDKEKIIRNDNIKHKELNVGTWLYKKIPFEESKKGFRLFSSDVRKSFLNEMKASINQKNLKKLSFKLSDLHNRYYDKSQKSIRDLGAYLETIWELTILCPIPYFKHGDKYPINPKVFTEEEKETEDYISAKHFIRERQKSLLKYNFHVIFDGIELLRHIQLPTENDSIISKIYFLNFNKEIFESPLKFSGYIFAQIPTAVRPFELNGVQIKLRDVGIGGYDSTYLKYSKEIETIRSRWVSGEIFVDMGLESALNIDRDSFNEHDEHYKALQTYLHDQLDPIFNELRDIARKRSDKRYSIEATKLRKSLEDIIDHETDGKLKLVQKRLSKDDPIVKVNKTKGEIILNTSQQPLNKKKANDIMGSVMIAYHAVKNISEGVEEQEAHFYKLIKRILDTLI